MQILKIDNLNEELVTSNFPEQCNSGDNGKNFLVGYLSIGWMSLIRMIVLLIGTFLLSQNTFAEPDAQDQVLSLTGQSGLTVPLIQLTGDFTVESWIYFSAGEAIHNQDGIVKNSNNNQDINFYLARARLFDQLNGHDVVTAQTAVTPQEWYHVAITRQAGTVRLYIDGQLDATGSSSYTATFSIDRIGSTAAGHLHGNLEDTRIWSVARSAQEITDSMNNAVASNTAGLIASYDYNSKLSLQKTVATIYDPVNNLLNPKSIPGAVLEYTLRSENMGGGPTDPADPDGIVLTDLVPANTKLCVADILNCKSPYFEDGSPTSGLSLSAVTYSTDGVNYSPSSSADADGANDGVSHLRMAMSGTFQSQTGVTTPHFTLKFRVVVK